jgi:hypothetical protein
VLHVVPARLPDPFEVAAPVLKPFAVHLTIRADDLDRSKLGMVLSRQFGPSLTYRGRPCHRIKEDAMPNRKIVGGQGSDHVVSRPTEPLPRESLPEQGCLEVVKLDMEERTASSELACNRGLAHTGQP